MFKLLMAAAMIAALTGIVRAADDAVTKGNDWYVAPDGKAANTGAKDSPWDIYTAFAGPAVVKPGDTIWLTGGTYGGKMDLFAKLNGQEGKPISVRQMPGERATIDIDNHSLWLWGTWTDFYDFEVCSLAPRRSGFTNAQFRFGGDENGGGQHCKAIGLIIHDTFNVGFWRSANPAEMHGCIVYNNGVAGHGHSLYVQNIAEPKNITDNIFFNAFSRGIAPHGSQFNINLNIEGNISFGNGSIGSGPFANLYNWAAKDTKNLRFVSNMTYHPVTVVTDMSADIHQGRDVTLQDNYIVGGGAAILVSDWDKSTVTGNTIVFGKTAVWTIPPKDMPGELLCDKNKYFSCGNGEQAFNNGASGKLMNFAAWKALGYDANSEWNEGKPKANVVFVRKNKYEEGRANICAYNWEGKDSVKVKVDDIGLKTGDKYEVRDVQNWFGKPIVTGTYDGTEIEISLKLTEVQQPFGDKSEYKPAKHTAPEFGAFVIVKAKG